MAVFLEIREPSGLVQMQLVKARDLLAFVGEFIKQLGQSFDFVVR